MFSESASEDLIAELMEISSNYHPGALADLARSFATTDLRTTLPTITVPTIVIPGASGTQPPSAKLNADQAREKVKDTLASCRLLQTEIGLSQVTFEPPTWKVRLPLTGATWSVDDVTGAVTPDERATERIRTCR